MLRATSTLLLATLLLSACTADGIGFEDAERDTFTAADGKADGYDLTEAQALAVMRVAAEASEAQLQAEVGLTARVAGNIAAYRAGDQQFDSLAELDAIAYVGPVALERLLAHAEQAGLVDDDALGRHDVSILVPLPASGDLPWTATTPGRGGALLPRTVFDRIERSLISEIEDADEYAALRVVAVRFDPCFTVSLTSACQPQLRLVFQALSDEYGTHDGAIHALYNLTAAQAIDVTTKLRALGELSPQARAYAPLGVHPTLRAQGMTGRYANGLLAVIAEYCGPATLARMTFMTRTLARQAQWEFGGFHIKATPATGFPAAGPIEIVDGATVQVLGNAALGGGHRYAVTPRLADATGHDGLLAPQLPQLSAATRTRLRTWALAQQSPLATVPDTTDCVSCHISGHVTNALEALDPAASSLDRGPRAIGDAESVGNNLRSFGYSDGDPFVSIRTANETAAVVRMIASQNPGS